MIVYEATKKLFVEDVVKIELKKIMIENGKIRSSKSLQDTLSICYKVMKDLL